MSKRQHTPEPWSYKGPRHVGQRDLFGRPESDGTPLIAVDVPVWDAARIVACVNYCAGLDDDQLGPLTALEYIGELETRAENAESAARAAREVARLAHTMVHYVNGGPGDEGSCSDLLDKALRAYEAATGKDGEE